MDDLGRGDADGEDALSPNLDHIGLPIEDDDDEDGDINLWDSLKDNDEISIRRVEDEADDSGDYADSDDLSF